MTRFIILAFLLLLTFVGAEAGEQKILYYRNPMGLPDTSQTPKKDQMGMDYIPVYADEEKLPSGTVVISPEKTQRIGVKTEAVAKRAFGRGVHAPGVAVFDESRLFAVAPKYSGWIEKLYVNTTGQAVKKGAPLMEVYSPELIDAQRDYLVARKLQRGEESSLKPTLDRQLSGAATRLGYFDFSKSDLERLVKDGKILRTVTIRAPSDGVVIEKNIVDGASFASGAVLYRLADTGTMWVEAGVAEGDLARIGAESPVVLHFKAYPDRSFEGTVHHIHPTLDATTRTGMVKIILQNADGAILSGMYADVEIGSGKDGEKLSVPVSAVIDSGSRRVVIVELGEGRFAPRPVRLGVQNSDYAEVLEGLAEGEKVVTRANFLIDAESNLKAALEAFSNGGKE